MSIASPSSVKPISVSAVWISYSDEQDEQTPRPLECYEYPSVGGDRTVIGLRYSHSSSDKFHNLLASADLVPLVRYDACTVALHKIDMDTGTASGSNLPSTSPHVYYYFN